MNNSGKLFDTVDAYIESAPLHVRDILNRIRAIAREEAPDAIERISYGMPSFYLNDGLFFYAYNKNHLGIYPHAEPIEVFKEKLKDYKTSRGAIRFPYHKEIPYELIREIIRFRVMRSREKKTKQKYLKIR